MTQFDDYLARASEDQAKEFERIRAIVHVTVPHVEETISYGLPTYKYKEKPLLYVGVFKNHMSFFPTPGPIEAFKDRLAPYKVSKGTVQFTLDRPLSEELIRDIIAARMQSIDG